MSKLVELIKTLAPAFKSRKEMDNTYLSESIDLCDLERRMREHKHKLVDGFTKKYKLDMLVYYEAFEDIRDAIAREKQIKAWRRSKRVELIESMNPDWRDLAYDWFVPALPDFSLHSE